MPRLNREVICDTSKDWGDIAVLVKTPNDSAVLEFLLLDCNTNKNVEKTSSLKSHVKNEKYQVGY